MVRRDKNFFRLYQNKSSLLKRFTRFVQGGVTDPKVGRLGFWDRNVEKFAGDVGDEIFVIDSMYEGRPDLLAFDRYGRSDLAWVILLYNNIVDLDDFRVGAEIALPTRDYLLTQIISETVKVSDVRTS